MPATGLAYSESCILTRSNRQGVLHPVWPSEHHAISDHDDRGLLGHGRYRSRGLVPLGDRMPIENVNNLGEADSDRVSRSTL